MAYPYQTQGFTLDNSGRRIVVDPVTRIEGHMRCEVNIDSNNVIRFSKRDRKNSHRFRW